MTDKAIDFLPAPPGWRALWIDADGLREEQNVAFFAVCEDADDGQRYLMPAVNQDGFLGIPPPGDWPDVLLDPSVTDQERARLVREIRRHKTGKSER